MVAREADPTHRKTMTPREADPTWAGARRLGAAGTAAGIAALITNPVEILRVRFQLEPPATRPPSVFTFARDLVKQEGFVKGFMQPGVLAWMCSMGVAFSFRMVMYEPLRESIERATNSKPTPATAFVAGLATGALTNAAACPFFNVKALQQSRPAAASPSGSFLTELAAVTRRGGLAGHYRGWPALFLRGGAISAGQLSGYDAAKRVVRANGMQEGPRTHVGCSLFAAACASVLSLPPDIILNRFQGAPTFGVHYSSLWQCTAELVRREGGLALFRGLGPQYMKLAPVFLVTLPLYEQLRRLVGIGYLK